MSRPLLPGDPRRIGRYRLLARLGQGGMGTVYLGETPEGRPVALKMVRPEHADDPEYRGRFRSEVNRAQQVPPFSTAEVLDADPCHDPPYLVVEYVNGPSLDTILRDQGPLTGAALQSLAIGTATALTAIHGAGVIHRDLKPANVLLPPGGIKVIDFGIARPQELTSHHTATDQMIGTIAYMAPERFEPAHHHSVGYPADIFAWGAVIAHAASGRTPFAAHTPAATALRILTEPPLLTDLPSALHDLVERALAKDPADRPTARQLLDALLAGPGPVVEPPVPPPPAPEPEKPAPASPAGQKRRGKVVSVVLAVLAVAALVAAATLTDVFRGQPGSLPVRPSGMGTPAPPSVTPSTDESAIFAGNRRALLHLAEIDRDLALPEKGPARASAGTGDDALFSLDPVGVDYLIKSVVPDKDGERCLGVRVDPAGPGSLTATDCEVTKATLFVITPTGEKDDKGRPTYSLSNAEYGLVQWSEERRAVYVEHPDDFPDDLTVSFVDRGAL
ncbi:serine/threonine-protein kinase [Actinoplanes sp. NPDC051346]|uniref:serine/threonine-protein kinase n=1 Tax=Actinoplanes sp. NPDC051346 TaxID=3155048 RepID=UPI00343CEDBE